MLKNRIITLLPLCACFFALSVIGLGAFTRLVDAGLGCPDWPGCYGHLIVSHLKQPLSQVGEGNLNLFLFKAWAEMIHRYFAACLSLLITSIVVIIFAKKAYRSRSNIILAFTLIALVIYQIILGQWTVTLKLLPAIVTQHLLGGFLIVSTLWLVYLNNASVKTSPSNGKEKFLLPFGILALIILLLQIILGAWTSTHYASFSCPDFPFCQNNQIIMPFHFKEAFEFWTPVGINYDGGVLPEAARQTIQMTHRLGALIFTLYMLFFAAIALPQLKNAPQTTSSFYLILGLLMVQLCLGISNVIFKLPLMTAISHNIVAVLMLLTLITFNFNLIVRHHADPRPTP